MTSNIASALPTSTSQGTSMTSTTPFARLCAAGNRAAALLVPLAPVLTRLVFGQAFFVTGMGKLGNLAEHTQRFVNWGIPFASIQAPINGALEMVGGLALMLGLFTRSFAFLLAGSMVVALLTADRNNLINALPFGDGLANVGPVPFLVAMVWLIAIGAGAISVDRFLARRRAAASASST